MFLERRIRTRRGRRRAKVVAFGAASIAYACLIFYASSLSTPPEMVKPFFLDMSTLAHLAEFALLGGLLFLTFAHASWRPWDAPVAVVLGVVYGAVDEFHQSYVPGRFADPADAVMDALGVVIAVAILAYLDHRVYSSEKRETARKR